MQIYPKYLRVYAYIHINTYILRKHHSMYVYVHKYLHIFHESEERKVVKGHV